jgi:hypothetical protein
MKLKRKIIGILIIPLLITSSFSIYGINEYLSFNSAHAEILDTWTMKVWADSDSYIDVLGEEIEGDENHGNEGCLKIGRMLHVDHIYHSYILIKFNLNEIPNDAVITKAILWMTPLEGGLQQLEVARIIDPWNEETVTWNNQPRTPTGPHIPNLNDPQLYFWNITSLFNHWWTGTIDNYGIKIIPYTYGYYLINFHDRLDLDPQNWPRIEITYQGSPPPPWDPPDHPEDNYNPIIDISINPPNPNPGDLVTVGALASDDVGLRWMRLTVTGPFIAEEWDTDIWLGETPHTISIIQEFEWGIHYVEAEVRDVSGKSNSAFDSFEIIGSNTPPDLSISCSPLNVWPEDNKTINITVTTSDPEGIRVLKIGLENGFISPHSYPDHGEIITYAPPYPKEVIYEYSTKNINVPHRFNPLSHDYTNIICKAHAQDTEYLWSNIETCEINITRPYQWDYGLPFINPTRNTVPWQCMYDIFGENECCWGSRNQYHTNRARVTYNGYGNNKLGVKYLCNGGECVGMSCYSLVYAAYGREIPNHYTHTGEDDYMRPWSTTPFANAENCVKRSIERFQGAQYSDNYLEIKYNQYINTRSQRNPCIDFCEDIIPDIQDDIENGIQGYISIRSSRSWGSSGHAVVPWYIKYLENLNTYHIYVYDSNRYTASWFNETNPNVGSNNFNDYNNYELYPYISVNPTGMWFKFNNDEQWHGMIAYIPFNVAVKDDYRLPHGFEYFLVLG